MVSNADGSLGDGADRRFVVAKDGTALALRAEGRRGGVPLLLTNGLSTTEAFFRPLVAALGPDHRVHQWRYRGHAPSESARSGDYTIDAHADDLARVTEVVMSEAGAAPVHVAFSMGVRVLLEMVKRHRGWARAMVLVAGGADHPHASSPLFRLPGARAFVRGALRAAAPVVPRAAPVVRRVAASRVLYPLSRAIGAIGEGAPRQDIEHFYRAFGEMDLRAYWESIRGLMEAGAADGLPSIDVPVLVVAPERDVMTSRRDMEALRDSIPTAEWAFFPGTGHAMLLEAGAEVAARVRAFLART